MAELLPKSEWGAISPRKMREMCRSGKWTGPNIEACRNYVMTNLAVVPKEFAGDFLLFCQRNPLPCPVLEVTEVGSPHPKVMASDADLRTDLPRYLVFRDGVLVEEATDVTKYWRSDLVSFLLGCSGNLQWAADAANIKYRFTGSFNTNIDCAPAGRFKGKMVVSGRLLKGSYNAVRMVQVTSRHLAQHGPPIHIGNPALIGIADVMKADRYVEPAIDPPYQEPDEIPMFWACGETPQTVAVEAKLPLMITHKGGHMFKSDKLFEEMANL